jgi:hypothetical protein
MNYTPHWRNELFSLPWASPLVLVKKKNDTVWFCVDYRKLNVTTRKDVYPIPRVDETLDTLAGSHFFTTLDLLSGYWQVQVHPDDKEKTAVTTPEGLFEFNVMPFGLCNAPATFQRLMDCVLAGLHWETCLVYLDDVIIIGKSFEDHLHNLHHVFQRFREAGLKLKPTKCTFCQPEVSFLGHVVSRTGIATDPSKVESIRKWPAPTQRKEVQQFLGLCNYYRRFIQNFATIAKPLYRLTEKTCEFQWSVDCENAFATLKARLATAPVLAFPDTKAPFILDTDASDTGVGAVLAQQVNGVEKVIAYGSKVLTKSEHRYCVTRRELLAVVTFLKHFRPYLLGCHFTVRTDHGSLAWLRNFKDPEGQLARWLEQLQEYDFEIVHRPGRLHRNADALSRIPCKQCGRENHTDHSAPEQLLTGAVIGNPHLDGVSSNDMQAAQEADPNIGDVLQALKAEKNGSSIKLQGKSREFKRLVQISKQLVVKDGLLYRVFESEDGEDHSLQLVVPTKFRKEVLYQLHDAPLGGHLGADKTHSKLKQRFYWPGYWNDVKMYCLSCQSCATRKAPTHHRKAPLQPIVAGYPLEIVAVDITGPFPETEKQNRYILVVGDYFSKWTEAYAIPNQEATTVAQKLVNEFFCRFSIPLQLHSDQGRQFESKLIQAICQILKIHKTRTTPYHPQSDGQVERFNRTMTDLLAIASKDHPFEWEEPKICLAYNTSVHKSTGFTPFSLMFGREASLPVDIMYTPNTRLPVSVPEYASQLRDTLSESFERVRQSLATKQEVQKQLYDNKVHGDPYKVGNLVWFHNPVVPQGTSRKLHHPWSGPYKIVKCLSDVNYRIQSLEHSQKRLFVHFDRHRPCTSQPPSCYDPSELRDTLNQPQPAVGAHLEVVEPDDHNLNVQPMPWQRPVSRRYPQRSRRPPDRYEPLHGF